MSEPFDSPPKPRPDFDLFAPAVDPAERRRLWLQVVLVLALAVFPDVYGVVESAVVPANQFQSETWVAWAAWSIGRSIQVIVTLLAATLIGGESLRSLGFRRPSWIDPSLVLVIFIAGWGAYYTCANSVVEIFGYTERTEYVKPTTSAEWSIVVVAHILNGFAEEIAIWGFLYTRLRRLWHTNELPSIIIAPLCFASYHIYQGVDGAVLVMVYGLVHGVVFHLTRRILPLAIEHAITNLVAILLW